MHIPNRFSTPAWRRSYRYLNPAGPMSHSQVLGRYHAGEAQEKHLREQSNKTPSGLTNNLGSVTSIIHNAFLVHCHSSKQKQRLLINVQWFSNDLEDKASPIKMPCHWNKRPCVSCSGKGGALFDFVWGVLQSPFWPEAYSALGENISITEDD